MHFPASALLLVRVFSIHSSFPSQAHASCEHLYGGGWSRVRHVPPGYQWHPSTDSLAGTQVYGSEDNDAAPWSVIFSSSNAPGCDAYDQFLFATGDCTRWLAATTDSAIGNIYANMPRPILASSDNPNNYQARWYNRGSSEDPWISIVDHGSAIGAGKIVYGENRFGHGHAANILPHHDGADVYIRNGNCTLAVEAPSFMPSKMWSGVPSIAPSPRQTLSGVPSISPSDEIPSWAIVFDNINANFSKSSGSEVVLEYIIGKHNHQVTLYPTGCSGDEITNTDAINVTTSVKDINRTHEVLQVEIDVEKNVSALGDNYDRANNTFSFCSFVELLSSKLSNTAIESNKYDFEVKLNLTNTFEVKDVNLTEIYVGSDTITTAVLGYVTACACADASGECIEDLTISGKVFDDTVSVCISSESNEMEVDYLDRFVMNGNGEEMIIVESAVQIEPKISSVKKYHSPWKGVVASSKVPTRFFSYTGEVNLTITGVVYLKLAGSSRRVAVLLAPAVHQSSAEAEAEVLDVDVDVDVVTAGGSFRALQQSVVGAQQEESAFAVNIGLKKTELELDNAAEGNGAVSTLVSSAGSGIVMIAAAATMGSAVMMW